MIPKKGNAKDRDRDGNKHSIKDAKSKGDGSNPNKEKDDGGIIKSGIDGDKGDHEEVEEEMVDNPEKRKEDLHNISVMSAR